MLLCLFLCLCVLSGCLYRFDLYGCCWFVYVGIVFIDVSCYDCIALMFMFLCLCCMLLGLYAYVLYCRAFRCVILFV